MEMDGLVCSLKLCGPLPLETVLLRNAYLLSEHTLQAGVARQLFHFFHPEELPLDFKLKEMERVSAEHGWFPEMPVIMRNYNKLKKTKHPRPAEIRIFRQLEKSLDAIFTELHRGLEDQLTSSGMMQTGELASYGLFDWYHLEEENMLVVPGEKSLTALQMLLLPQQAPADRPMAFCLPAGLLQEYIENTPANEGTSSAGWPEGLVFLQRSFLIPDLLLLSPHELHMVKMQLKDAAGPFHACTNEWAKLCRSGAPASDTSNYFRQQVLPAASTFQEALLEAPLLKQLQHRSLLPSDTEAWLGEISPAAVMRLLRKQGQIEKEELWKELEAKLEEPEMRQPVPFIMLKAPAYLFEDQDPLPFPQGKKSIDIN